MSADETVSYLDRAVPPCTDFFRYANGAWIARAEIPPEEPAWGAFYEIRDRNLEILHEICEDSLGVAAPEGSIVRKVGDLYASGMDEEGVERAGLTPLADLFVRIEALPDRAALPGLVAELHALRVGAGFAFFVLPDAKRSDVYLAQLQQAGLGLPDRDYYTRDDERSRKLRDEYVTHVRRTFVLLGDDEGRAAEQAGTILRLETRLANASMTRVDQRDPYKTYHKRAAARLDEVGPEFPWDAYLAALGGPAMSEINVRQPEFFAELSRMTDEVPLEEWRTYLRWHVARSFSPYLGRAFVDQSFSFYDSTLQGVQRIRPRWKRVIDAVDENLGEALGQLYVERVFPPEAKRRVLDMVDDLRAVLAERIRELPWMGDATKAQALGKLAKFRVKMAYPDAWRDYAALAIDRGPYVANVRRGRRFEFERQLRRVGGPVDRDEWRMTPPTVNAYYTPMGNEIVFPAGILVPPFFDFEADDALNYGAIGAVIGHEMTHGFDDSGSKYDADGNLRDWWTPDDRAAYEARTDLVVKQFEVYEPLPGLRVNGKLTLGENIADLGGVKIAYAAFRRSLAGGTEPPPIDGFTAAQRFFIGYAQVWRSKVRDEQVRLRVYTDPHAPGEFRVIGPLSNLPEFHAAFSCSAGAPMFRAPEVRPMIW